MDFTQLEEEPFRPISGAARQLSQVTHLTGQAGGLGIDQPTGRSLPIFSWLMLYLSDAATNQIVQPELQFLEPGGDVLSPSWGCSW